MFHTKQDVDRHVNEIFKNLKTESERNSKCYQIAKHYYKVNDYKSAIKYINRYITTTSGSAAAHKLLGEAYLAIGSKLKAHDAFKTSLELDASQRDLVLKICELLTDPEVLLVAPRATYWLERAESLFPKHTIVFKLKEHLLKCASDGKEDNGQMEKLILSEIHARPNDVTVRVRLIHFFMETKRYKLAYQHILDMESRNMFYNDLRWYDCLCTLMQAYEKANNDSDFEFHVKKIIFLERRTSLSMQEFQAEVKSITECSCALFAFDQALHTVSKIQVPSAELSFFNEFMKHMRAQLSFHVATLALKRAKKEYGIWQKAVRSASPLLLQATQPTLDLDDGWYSVWVEQKKKNFNVKLWNREAAFRVSQAGHILRALSQDKGHQFLEKVSQFCGGKWRTRVYQDVFYNRDHQQAMGTSHFMNDSSFANVPLRLLNDAQLNQFDELSQSTHPDSLHHLVWLGLASFTSGYQLSHNFRCVVVPNLQFTVEYLSNTGPETLNQLDVDTFLYASVLCAKSAIPSYVPSDRPSRLPVSISEDLCSTAQAEWWLAVYKTHSNQTNGNISEVRLRLRKGIETVRMIGQHGLHVKLIVLLAKLFQERAANNKNLNELPGLEARTNMLWTTAIPLLEKIEKNHQLRQVPNRLFDYKGKDISGTEVKGYLEDGRLFLACQLMKQGRNEEAIEAFSSLKSPYATFYQALIYKKLASEEVNHRPESITSENRSQHIILLTRARDALFLTLDRLRSPSIDPAHPLNTQLGVYLEEVETQLARIDPDSSLNRNGDAESDESDIPPGPLSPENLDSSFNVYNANNFLAMTHQSTPRVLRQSFARGHHTSRTEARPSPERLDAQLRHLVQANSSGLLSVLQELKDIKSVVENSTSSVETELKDLKLIVRDLLSEFKKSNEHSETAARRGASDDIKAEDLFEFPDEEDYEDLNQITQQYPGYQNFPAYRQMSGLQGTSTVTYGAPVPPAVPTMLPPGTPLIPPSFFSGVRPVPPVDPNLLLYQTLGYYAQGGLPFSEGQNLPDFRGTGIQKGAPFAKNGHTAPTEMTAQAMATTPKPQTPNVVITSSDTLPAYTNTGTPAMSVTIPPQHLRGVLPSAALAANRTSPNQVHAFQIPMPPQAQMVHQSPKDKTQGGMLPVTTTSILNSVPSPVYSAVKTTPPKEDASLQEASPVTSPSREEAEIDPRPDFKPIIPLPDEVEVRTGEEDETKLFESRARLYVFVDKEWKERGVGPVKVLHNEKSGKARIVMRRDQVFKICANHNILPEMELTEMKNNDRAWIWGANDYSDGEMVLQKFCIRFKNSDEARDFEYAFNKAKELVKEGTGKKGETFPSASQLSELVKHPAGSWECPSCYVRNVSKDVPCVACGHILQQKPTATNLPESKGNQQITPLAKQNIPVEKNTLQDAQVNSTVKQDAQIDPKEITDPKSGFKGFSFMKAPTLKLDSSKSEELKDNQKDTCKEASKTDDLKIKEREDSKTNFGGFTFMKAPVLKLDSAKVEEPKEKPKEEVKPSPFAGFSFSTPKTGEEAWFGSSVPASSFSALAAASVNSNAFKKSDDSKAFEGAGSLVFGSLSTPKTESPAVSEKTDTTPAPLDKGDATSKQNEEEGQGDATEFVPTAEFAPVIPLPDLVEVKTGEEGETMLYEGRAKVLRYDSTNGQWKERGVGMMKVLLNEQSGKVRLLMRREQVLKVCCNHFLDEKMEFKPMLTSDKALIWCAQDYSEGDLKCELLAIRFGKVESMQEFKRIIEDTQKKLKDGRMEGFEPQGGGDIKPQELKPLSELFKPKPGSWECSSCYTRNKEEALKCVSCETNKPGCETNSNDTLTKPSTETKEPKGIVLDPTLASRFSFGIPKDSAAVSDPTKASAASSIFGDLAQKKTEGEQHQPFVFGIPVSGANQEKTPVPFSFTGVKGDAKDFRIGSPGKFEFSFSGVKQQSVKSPGKPKSPGDNITSGEESGDEPEEDDGDHITFKPLIPLPDKVPVHTGEEDEDVVYVHRAKLFRFINGEWKERGLGDIKILKHKTSKKVRLLMRREQVLKICLNHYITREMEFLPKDEKTWLWSAADFSENEVRHDSFAMRFKTSEIADDFRKAIDGIQKTLDPSPVKSESSSTMKNFTFSVPSRGTPKSTGTVAGVARNLFAADDDVSIVYESQVTPEERDAALKLQLPPNFYAYLRAPGCPGCIGCEDDSETKSNVDGSKSGKLYDTSPSQEEKTLPPHENISSSNSPLFSTVFNQPTTGAATSIFGGSVSIPKGSLYFGSSNVAEKPWNFQEINFSAPQDLTVRLKEAATTDEKDESEGIEIRPDIEGYEGSEYDSDVDDDDDDEEEEEEDSDDSYDSEAEREARIKRNEEFEKANEFVLVLQDFRVFRFHEEYNKYFEIGLEEGYPYSVTLKLYKPIGKSGYRIFIGHENLVISETFVDPEVDTVFKMSQKSCLWVGLDKRLHPPEMTTLVLIFHNRDTLSELLYFFGEHEPPEELLRKYKSAEKVGL